MSIPKKIYWVVGCVMPLAGVLFLLRKRGRARIFERYGSWQAIDEKYPIAWFHGASVGEVGGLIPIIRSYRSRYPNQKILLTATSVTGLERGFGEADYVRLIPFDWAPLIKRAIKDIKVSLFVFGETEIWPALTEELYKRSTPILLVNGRISDKTINLYRRIRVLLSDVLTMIDSILTSSEVSRDRFIELGAKSDRVKAIGDTKFDVSPSIKTKEEALNLKQSLFSDNFPVFTLGSLRSKEEGVWFTALSRAQSDNVKLNVIIAPRHQERFEYFASALKSAGLRFRLWSKKDSDIETTQGVNILLVDELGVLESLYSCSDGAFIGGTVANIGGHNPLEIAMYGVPIVMGRYTSNIKEISEMLFLEGGAILVSGVDDAYACIKRVADQDPSLTEIGEAGRRVWKRYTGATKKVMKEIEGLLQDKQR